VVARACGSRVEILDGWAPMRRLCASAKEQVVNVRRRES